MAGMNINYRAYLSKLLRKPYVSFFIRTVDTFVHVFTFHALCTVSCYMLLFSLLFVSYLNWTIIVSLATLPLALLLTTLVKEWYEIEVKLGETKYIIHLSGEVINVKHARNKHVCNLGTLIIGQLRRVKIYVHVVNAKNIFPISLICSKDSEYILADVERTEHLNIKDGFIKIFCVTLTGTKSIRSAVGESFVLNGHEKSLHRIVFVAECILPSYPNSSISEFRVFGWKYGKRAAFCWRSDFCYLAPHKGMDTKALQRMVELMMKWRIPFTLFISGRMVLDLQELVSTYLYFGLLSKEETEQMYNEFLGYLKSLNINQYVEYPNPECAIAIGNHSYFHQGKFAGASSSNDWNGDWRLETADKQWFSKIPTGIPDKIINNYTFNQLNALVNNKLLKDVLGVSPKTWSAPRNEATVNMAKELEDIGILYASEADAYRKKSHALFPRRPKENVCFPYHPTGCSVLVESRCVINPYDCSNLIDVISLKKTIKKCIKMGAQVTILIHPHMNIHKKKESIKYVERFLQIICENLDYLWATSHESMLEYWELTRCPLHSALIFDPEHATVTNNSTTHLEDVPIYIEFSGGIRMVKVLSFKPYEVIDILKLGAEVNARS